MQRGRQNLPAKSKSPAFIAVVDASLCLAATFSDEKFYALSLDLLTELGDAGAHFMAPPLWESETSSAVRMRVETKKTTTPDEEKEAYAFLDSIPVEIVHSPKTKQRARDLAIQLGLNRAYDATYLALALDEGATLWTADERFYNAAGPSFPSVKFLGNWQSGDPVK